MYGQVGVGLGMGLLSALEGRRQAEEIAKTNMIAQKRHDETMAMLQKAISLRMGV